MQTTRPWLDLDDALARLVAGAAAHAIAQTDTISTFDALGRVLAADVLSALDVPPEDNTAMDGYALRVADVPAAGTLLPVSQRIPAGHVGGPLQPGTAARIFTGGQIPAGADAVVMQELCEAVADAENERQPAVGDGPHAGAQGEAGFGAVRVNTVPATGAAIRRRGEDVRAGAAVLRRGQRLTPQALGLAASVGAGTLTVWRRPRVAIFSTGDELMMPGEALRPGAIYNSNRYTLRALLQAAGCEVHDLGIVGDTLDATRAALREAARGNDLIVTCGGVSVGDEDHLKPAAQAEGELQNWQLAIKPGKPLAFGSIRRGSQGSQGSQGFDGLPAIQRQPNDSNQPINDGNERNPGNAGVEDTAGAALLVGLPGNPVSAFVTYLLTVNTVLRALQGMDASLPAGLPMRADFSTRKAGGKVEKRREFLRARINTQGGLDLFDNQSSGVLTSAVWADGLIDNPAGTTIGPGDTVRFLPLAELIAR